MADWAGAFRCKVHLPVADSQWVTDPGDYIQFWAGTKLAGICMQDTLVAARVDSTTGTEDLLQNMDSISCLIIGACQSQC